MHTIKPKSSLLILLLAVFLSSCASDSNKRPTDIASKLVSGKLYYIDKAMVKLSIDRIGGNRKIQYTSEEALTNRFYHSVKKQLQQRNLLTNNPEESQASVSFQLNFTRTFVAFTNRRKKKIKILRSK